MRTEGAAPSADQQAIVSLINQWIVHRDGGDWARLRPIWHEDGRMTASWRQGTADEFIASNRWFVCHPLFVSSSFVFACACVVCVSALLINGVLVFLLSVAIQHRSTSRLICHVH